MLPCWAFLREDSIPEKGLKDAASNAKRVVYNELVDALYGIYR